MTVSADVERKSPDRTNLEAKANPLSRLFFGFMDSTVYEGFRRPLTADNIWEIQSRDTSTVVGGRLRELWDREVERVARQNAAAPGKSAKFPSFERAIIHFFFADFVLLTLIQALSAAAKVALPFILTRVLKFLFLYQKRRSTHPDSPYDENPDSPMYNPQNEMYLCGTLFFVLPFAPILLDNVTSYIATRLMVRRVTSPQPVRHGITHARRPARHGANTKSEACLAFRVPYAAQVSTAFLSQVNLRAGVAEVVYHKALRSDQALGMATSDEAPNETAAQDGEAGKGSVDRKGDVDGTQAPATTNPSEEKEGTSSATTGKIVNLMSSDAEKIGMIGLALPNTLINLPLIAVIMYAPFLPATSLPMAETTAGCARPSHVCTGTCCRYYLYDSIGPSAFAGLAVLLTSGPTMGLVMKNVFAASGLQSKEADQRIKIINELLQGIRVCKFYAWEKSFLENIAEIRTRELHYVFKISMWFTIFICTFTMLPIMLAFVSYMVWIATSTLNKQEMYGQIFRSLAFFNVLQLPMTMLPMMLSQFATGMASARRVGEFLKQPDLDHSFLLASPDDSKHVVEVKGSFRFGKKQAAASKDAAAKAEAGSTNAKASEMRIAAATVASAPPAPARATAEVLHDVDFGARKVRQMCVCCSNIHPKQYK